MGRRFAVLLTAGLFVVVAISAQPVVASAPPSVASTSSRQPAVGGYERSPAPASVTPASLTTGGTWSWQNPSPNGNSLLAISCPTASICFAAGEDGPILMTANGGSTWTQQAHAAGVNRISCASSTVCVAVGDGGLLMRTVDGGASWITQFPQVNNGGFLSSVSCPTVTVCFAGGVAGSIISINYSTGASTTGSWMAQYSQTTQNLFGMSCPSTSYCYAVGAGGVITGTSNGGTWSLETSGTTQPLAAISCASTTTCAAVGHLGTIVSTTTGATGWGFVGTETRADLLGISCPSTTICFSAGSDGEVHVGFSSIYGNTSVGANGRLWEISCPTITECLTAGDFGTVALTTTAGTGWSAHYVGLSGAVTGISCPSATVCFGVDHGAILRTTDGGLTWPQVFLSPSSTYFNAISCPTTMVCFAAGGATYSNDPMLLHSIDGGASWQPELYPAHAADRLDSISCATTTDCSAIDYGFTVTSTNDGLHWSAPTFGPCSGSCPSLSQISCVAPGACYVATTAVPGQIWTSAGGQGWKLSFDVANDPQGGGGNGFTAISCPSVTICYAVGPGPASPGPGGVYATTTDGGVTWRTDFGPSSTSVSGMSCPSVSTCYVAATGASIFHTSDFGSMWDVQLGNPNAWYLSVSCPSTTTCFAGGSAGSAGGLISATTTAGAAWTRPQPTGATTGIDGRGFDCGSASDCYAASFNNILVSHNGGSTWAAHPLTNGDLPDAMKCVSATTCYAVGWPGAIYKTIDGGTSWTYSPNPRSGQDTTLLGVSCWSASACVAVGTNGDVLSTSDGSSWGVEASNTFNNLVGVSCPSSSVCVAVGYNGTALTRAGNAWHAGASGTAVVLDGVACATTTICYAVGQKGTLLVTNNQGATWTAQSSGVTNNLFGIACVRPTFCLAAGSFGTAIATLDGSHWQGLVMPTTNNLHAVALPDPNHAWIAGSGGTILANPTLFPFTCTSVADSASPPSPSTFGTSVTFTASASNCPNPQYQFWILAPGSPTWTIVQPYSSSATYNWTTTGLAAGTYLYTVWVRDASSAASYDTYFPGTAYTLTTTACTSVSESASPASPQLAGTPVTFTAGASGCPNPRYQFWLAAPGGSWTIVQPYSSSATFNWNTNGLLPGIYYYTVWARDAASAASYDIYFSATTYLVNSSLPCSWMADSAAPASPQGSGTTVTFTASAPNCPSPRYQFWIAAPGGSWTIVQAYSPSATFIWNTIGLVAGTYYYTVWLRDASSAASYDTVFVAATFTLTTTHCTSVTDTPSPAPPQAHGTTVTFTAVASGGCTHPLYQFWILAPGSHTWTIMQTYSTSATFSWNTTGLVAGTYYYTVWVKDSGSANSQDAYFPGTAYTLT